MKLNLFSAMVLFRFTFLSIVFHYLTVETFTIYQNS